MRSCAAKELSPATGLERLTAAKIWAVRPKFSTISCNGYVDARGAPPSETHRGMPMNNLTYAGQNQLAAACVMFVLKRWHPLYLQLRRVVTGIRLHRLKRSMGTVAFKVNFREMLDRYHRDVKMSGNTL
jgi:hypothetical protein